ncbi:MAG: hypothetical protein ACFFBH_11370 [Promethearchaeota archaeon]
MSGWRKHLNFDPIPILLTTTSRALLCFVKTELVEEKDLGSIEQIWELEEAQKILKKQQKNGAWKYSSRKEDIQTQENYNQLETYRQLGYLVELYKFKKSQPSIKKAAEYLFSFQTDEGDFRGIYGTQYSPNYSAGILEILIKAGYENDQRTKKCLNWLLSMRQNDGGWVIPIQTYRIKWQDAVTSKEILQPIKNKPFSYMVTGVILRAFAAHSKYRRKSEVRLAGELLLSRFFERDNYPARGDKSYWTKFTFPFWFTDLLSSLDSLYFIGFNKEHPQISRALKWFIKEQGTDGNWNLKLLKGARIKDYKLWINFVICRTFKRYFS